jgi:hypothetical protein
VPSAPAGGQVLLLPPRKPDGPVWHSGLSSSPVPKLLCPVDGRHVHSGHPLHNSIHGQNRPLVLTIPDERASAVVPMAHTTLPKENKVGTSSAEAPTAQALVASLGNMAPDDNLGDGDPNLLNPVVVESETVCRLSS